MKKRALIVLLNFASGACCYAIDESSQDFKNQTLLIHSSHGNLTQIKCLLDKGMDGSTGRHAIGRAALAGREDVVHFLIKHGKFTLNNTYGETPIDYVNKNLLSGEQKDNMILILRKYGAKTSAELREEQ